MSNYKYGIVIDSGSSGSRVQIYRWEDVAQLRKLDSPQVLGGPPQITQEDGWSKKILPGISSFSGNHKKVWSGHYKELFRFAEHIIPQEKIPETPVYILSTAGMRLIPEQNRQAILAETCKAVKKNTKFYLGNCDDHVQTIDGSTEGVYGWLALNYLMSLFDQKSGDDVAQKSIGFMDMGGASTQIAFVPSDEEIQKHDEDLATVTLRSIDGNTHRWRVFVETWLGFGANQGRRRYLENLISLAAASRPGTRLKTVLDPCMPSGSVIKDYQFGQKKYKIEGTGNYESCLREIYPLLMKHLPCKSEPCLFNGIHAPKMDFEADKFVGVSEYWYTANDIFHSGGEYNFHTYNEKVKEFCGSSWETIEAKSKKGEYSNLSKEYLLDACFKASWVINILHEGFGLPRLQLEIDSSGSSEEEKQLQNVHVPFKSADSVEGRELSWTLGKILLVASAQIESSDGAEVGVIPSAISQRLLDDGDSDSDDESVLHGLFWLLSLVLYVTLGYLLFYGCKIVFSRATRRKFSASGWPFSSVLKQTLSSARSKLPPFLTPPLDKILDYMEIQHQEDISMDLEEGNSVFAGTPVSPVSVLRPRSTLNFIEDEEGGKRTPDFMSRPFVSPKVSAFYNHRTESRDSLLHLLSSGLLPRQPK